VQASKILPKSSVAKTKDPEEIDSNLYALLLETGSSLLGLDNSGSVQSSDGSRLRRVTSKSQMLAATRKEQPAIAPKMARKAESLTPRTFRAPWQRSRRREKNDRSDAVERSKPTARPKSRRYPSNPFSGRLSRPKTNSSPSRAASPSITTFNKLEVVAIRNVACQPDFSDKKLNDAIMVFDAEEAPIPSTLSRVQSSKFIPSKDLMRQMERNLDRDSFVSDDELAVPATTQLIPAAVSPSQYRSKSQPRTQQRPSLENGPARQRTTSSTRRPLERQKSKRSSTNSRSANQSSGNRSMASTKSKSNRSHVTSKSRHTRASRATTRASSSRTAKFRESQARIATNQLSFSDDENGVFSVGSLDA
jgi:hypothetical protein